MDLAVAADGFGPGSLHAEWLKCIKKAIANVSNISVVDLWCRKQRYYNSKLLEDIEGFLENSTIHQKVHLWYVVDALCSSSVAVGEKEFSRLVLQRSLVLMHLVAPVSDPQGYMNIWNIERVISTWQLRHLFCREDIQVLLLHLENLKKAHELADASLASRLQKLERIRQRTGKLQVASIPKPAEGDSVNASGVTTGSAESLIQRASPAAALTVSGNGSNKAVTADSVSAADNSSCAGNTMVGFHPIIRHPPFNADLGNRLEADRDFSKRLREKAWARPTGDSSEREFRRLYDQVSKYPIDQQDIDAIRRSNESCSQGFYTNRAVFSDNSKLLLEYQKRRRITLGKERPQASTSV